VETLRALIDLYEQTGDMIEGIRAVEKALVYNGKDKHLLEKKDRFYYSLSPADLDKDRDALGSTFDADYCQEKARWILDLKDGGGDLLDWADHLTALVLVVQPQSVAARVSRSRILRRRGKGAEAQKLLEEVHDRITRPFASSQDEDAWFLASRLLGEIYLYETSQPELALARFSEYRKSPRSGADTLFKMGQAYERLGDAAQARKCYQNVSVYDGHPLVADARDALERLGTS
jgi:tetratricopeptide (TPR) repeat protein